jgi:hypothetical protein
MIAIKKEVEDLEPSGIQVVTVVVVYHLIKRTHVKHEYGSLPGLQINKAALGEGLPLISLRLRARALLRLGRALL